MLLQLRWYQLKELTRARFYNFWCSYRGNFKILDHAMKFKPTTLQTAIATEYKNIITNTYPEWEKLIEERRVILSEEFTLNRQAKQKAEKAREENDVEIEVIEPLVETIELEVDSDEDNVNNDEKKSNTDSNDIQNKNKESIPANDNNTIHSSYTLNCDSAIKSESDDDVLELDGLSDVEAMHIPLEKMDENKCSENLNIKSTDEIHKTTVNEILPKITNVVGNIIESPEIMDKREINIIAKENVGHDIAGPITKQEAETKDKNRNQCDSDGEVDEILCEKSNNLLNIEITQIKSEYALDNEMNTIEKNTITSEKLQTENIEVDSVNNPSCSEIKLSLCDSEGETDKVIKEKANNNIDIMTPETNVETIERSFNENPNASENIDGEFENTHAEHEIDEKDDIAKEEQTIQEKHDDCFDELEFDDDQIEFVDDGIEFVEEVQGVGKKIDLKTEPASDSEDDSTMEIDDCPKIDLKLLMNPTVYTKKLDLMDVFKSTDFTFVNDKKIIECAIFESKPIDKWALNDEAISKFREQAICGKETNGNQCDNDIVQTATEEANNRVKCTSWLLQKPKNRSYNPIQLCKNPDFNTRLKRLTAGFLSSTRNRVLLKECKPLTIDLHKAFEKKLINGTMYLKSGDFKSAKPTTADNISNELVSVLPSVIPGQSMIFSTSDTNNILATESNNLDDRKNNTPLSSVFENNPTSERRKINLPNIDQVRRYNQSLLTAEVTPIRIEPKINNTNSSKEPVSTTNDEPRFVQPIALTPLTQIKNEPSELDDKNNLQFQLHKPQIEISSREDLMANKINDQIINLSNQISEVGNNDRHSINIERTVQIETRTKNKVGRKPNSNKVPKPTPPPVTKLTYVPRYRSKLTWSPKYPKNHIADSLLTLDTLSKILFLLNGNEDEIKNCSCKQKKCLKQIRIEWNPPEIKQSTNEQGTNTVQSALTKCNITKSASGKKINQEKTKCSVHGGASKRRNRKRAPAQVIKYSGIYCCWAREKITNGINNKNGAIEKHGCLIYRCQCCCRHELIRLTSKKIFNSRNSKSSCKKNYSTIILSDDDDVNNVTQNNKEVVMLPDTVRIDKVVDESSNSENSVGTSNIVTEQSNNVTIEIMIPPLTPITKATHPTTSTNCDAKNIAIQTEMHQENVPVSNVQKLPHKEKDLQKKTCKTVVHAADGHVYNKRVETVISSNKEQNHSFADPTTSTNCDAKNLAIQTEMQQENVPVCNVQKLPHKEKDLQKKTCKTVVHSADGHVYNKRVETIMSSNKEQNHSFADPTTSTNCDAKNVTIQIEMHQENVPVCIIQKLPHKEKYLQKKTCKTIVHTADGHVYNKRVETIISGNKEKNHSFARSSVKSTENNDKQNSRQIERTLCLHSSQILNKPMRSPIYLGKNKILLCSLKNSNTQKLKNPRVTVAPVNPSLPVLPYGVNFVMLPNGELTVSIDNGTHLDSEQLSTLPALMAIVQDQYLKSNITNSIPEHNSVRQEDSDVRIVEENNATSQIIRNTAEFLDNPKEIQNIPTQNDTSIKNDKNRNEPDFEGSVLDSEIEVSANTTIQSEVNNTDSVCLKPAEDHSLPDSQIDSQIIEPESTAENQVNTSLPKENLVPSAESCLNDNDAGENNNKNTRKTILSDLMEMSGISAEDTTMVSEVPNPCPSITSLPPLLMPITRTSGNGNEMFNVSTNSNVPENITIAGPYSNLFSFEPTTPLNHLLNWIGHIRPELNAVTSFAELKYVYSNEGQFYKLDLDSGAVSEIKVLIKKNPTSQIPKTPKAFIDLTDDTLDSENVTCAEFQDAPQDSQGNVEVKPIKLFKAIHPTILKRSGRSILKESENLHPKKIIRISKQKRKQLLNMGNSYLLVDIEKDNEPKELDDPTKSHLDSSFDSSDEEPLAKKRRRNVKPVENNVEETMPLFEDTLEHNFVPEETVSIPDTSEISDEHGYTSDLEINSMDIEGVNPELHPVAFEEGSDSDEDMCILGV